MRDIVFTYVSHADTRRRLLVFAHTPPPHHGQSVMVEVLVRGLRKSGGISVHHVNARLSRDLEDIGGVRAGKGTVLARHCLRAIWERIRHGRMALYYVPAPAKKSAILRDWLVMILLRPFFPDVILHWHAVGLGFWAETGKPIVFGPLLDSPARWLTRRLLGGARLSIVLTNANRPDAEALAPHRIAVIPNGLEDPLPSDAPLLVTERASGHFRCLYLAHCTVAKGLFRAVDAVLLANSLLDREGVAERISLSVCGTFPDEATRREFENRLQGSHPSPSPISYLGFLTGEQKLEAMKRHHCLVSFSEQETFGLNVAEGLAFGMIPCLSPIPAYKECFGESALFGENMTTPELAKALIAAARRPAQPLAQRDYFLKQFSIAPFLEKMEREIAEMR